MNTLLPDARASRTASAAASAMRWPTTSQLRPAPPLWPVTPKGAILECASAARALPKPAVVVRIHDRLKRSFSSRLSPPQTTVDKTCGTPTFNIVAGPQIAFSCGMVFLQVAPDVLGFLEPPTAKMLTTCRILASEYVETWIPSANAHTHTHANIIP